MKNFDKEDFRKFVKSTCSSSTLDYYDKVQGGVLGIKNGYINPTILEEREMNVTQMDIFSRLMAERTIFFGSDFNSHVCNVVIAQLLYLDSAGSGDITMYVNSPGGSVIDGYGVLDCMHFIKSDVSTICTGLAASMGSLLLMNGTRGKRSALPLSRVMIHQPLGGASGQATDILIEAEQIKQIRKEIYEIIAQRTNQPIKKISKDCERDYWMTAKEAKEYGIIDNVIEVKRD
jgi:ATP-dependent Clp protease protease subunit